VGIGVAKAVGKGVVGGGPNGLTTPYVGAKVLFVPTVGVLAEVPEEVGSDVTVGLSVGYKVGN